MRHRLDDDGVAGFDRAYQGRPAWDIGRIQPAIAKLEAEGVIRGHVLDVGCGTGETALYLAQRGYSVCGVDVSPIAVAQATEKADRRGFVVSFRAHDALALGDLGQTFDTVVEVGLFHVFDGTMRSRLVASLAQVLVPGGCYAFLCFSDRQPGPLPPFRISRADIDTAFELGWRVERVEAAAYETQASYGNADAWLVVVRRL